MRHQYGVGFFFPRLSFINAFLPKTHHASTYGNFLALEHSENQNPCYGIVCPFPSKKQKSRKLLWTAIMNAWLVSRKTYVRRSGLVAQNRDDILRWSGFASLLSKTLSAASHGREVTELKWAIGRLKHCVATSHVLVSFAKTPVTNAMSEQRKCDGHAMSALARGQIHRNKLHGLPVRVTAVQKATDGTASWSLVPRKLVSIHLRESSTQNIPRTWYVSPFSPSGCPQPKKYDAPSWRVPALVSHRSLWKGSAKRTMWWPVEVSKTTWCICVGDTK